MIQILWYSYVCDLGWVLRCSYDKRRTTVNTNENVYVIRITSKNDYLVGRLKQEYKPELITEAINVI